MCGIAAILDPARGTASRLLGPWRMPCATAGPTAKAVTRRAGDARAHPPGDHRRGRRRPAAGLRGRRRHRDRERRDLQPRRAPRRARGGPATASPPTRTREVVVHAYEEYGADFVSRLNGIYALRRSGTPGAQRLLAARDPFGVKPLYWWTDGRRVALASEVGALIAAGLVEARDRPGGARPLPGLPLRARAANHVRRGLEAARRHDPHWPRTAACEVHELPRPRPATRSPGAPTSWPRSSASASSAAVERQMMSDVPYGGPAQRRGRLGRGGRRHGRRLRQARPRPSRSASRAPATCSTSAPRPSSGARRSAPTTTPPRWTAATSWPSSRRACTTSRSPAACPPRPRCSSSAASPRSHVKVVLSGQGADEPHGGYGRHRAAAALAASAGVPAALGPARAGAGRSAARATSAPSARRGCSADDARRRPAAAPGRGHRPRPARHALAGTAVEEAEAERRAPPTTVLADVAGPRAARAGDVSGLASSSSPTAFCSAPTRCRWRTASSSAFRFWTSS